MYFTTEEIRNEIKRHWQEIADSSDPYEFLAELADGFVPVYNHEIIKDWQEMPAEFDDQWKEYGYDTHRNEGGIVRLMQVDLMFYYLQTTQEIYRDLKDQEASLITEETERN